MALAWLWGAYQLAINRLCCGFEMALGGFGVQDSFAKVRVLTLFREESRWEIVSLQGDEMARRRIEQLAVKCDAGALTPEERAEYQLFVEVGDLVALLQAKARRYLAEHPAA